MTHCDQRGNAMRMNTIANQIDETSMLEAAVLVPGAVLERVGGGEKRWEMHWKTAKVDITDIVTRSGVTRLTGCSIAIASDRLSRVKPHFWLNRWSSEGLSAWLELKK